MYNFCLFPTVLSIGFMWGIVLMCDHLVLMWAWASIKLLQSVDHHSGYDVPALVLINPMRILPFYAGKYTDLLSLSLCVTI